MEDTNNVVTLTDAQRIEKLEKQVAQISAVFTKFMQVPYKEQKDIVARLVPLLDMYEKKEGPFVEKKKTKRMPTNRADWEKVQACLNGGEENWSAIAKSTGIPQSTCRKYAKMTPEEVAALPPGINFEEEPDDDQE